MWQIDVRVRIFGEADRAMAVREVDHDQSAARAISLQRRAMAAPRNDELFTTTARGVVGCKLFLEGGTLDRDERMEKVRESTGGGVKTYERMNKRTKNQRTN